MKTVNINGKEYYDYKYFLPLYLLEFTEDINKYWEAFDVHGTFDVTVDDEETTIYDGKHGLLLRRVICGNMYYFTDSGILPDEIVSLWKLCNIK